jgi:hypothetical protein
VLPAKAIANGFVFRHGTLGDALAAMLRKAGVTRTRGDSAPELAPALSRAGR